jgi:hypothetical protein
VEDEEDAEKLEHEEEAIELAELGFGLELGKLATFVTWYFNILLVLNVLFTPYSYLFYFSSLFLLVTQTLLFFSFLFFSLFLFTLLLFWLFLMHQLN